MDDGEELGRNFLICSIKLVNGAVPTAIYVNFPVKFALKSPWRASTIVIICSLLGLLGLMMFVLVCIRRRARRRRVLAKALKGGKNVPLIHSSLFDSKQGTNKGQPLWRKSEVPRAYIKDSKGDVVCRPYNNDEVTRDLDVLTEHTNISKISGHKFNSKRTDDIQRLSVALGPTRSVSRSKSIPGGSDAAMASWKRWTNMINKQQQQRHSLDTILMNNRPRFIDLVKASYKVKDRTKDHDKSPRSSLGARLLDKPTAKSLEKPRLSLQPQRTSMEASSKFLSTPTKSLIPRIPEH